MDETDIILFAGQGGDRAEPLRQARSDVLASSRGKALLDACHQAFLDNLKAFSYEEQQILGILEADFQNPDDLLVNADRCKRNVVISSISLVLTQALRYIVTYIHVHQVRRYEYVGFSSGILVACAASTSGSIEEFLIQAVKAFDVAFWIGIHARRSRPLQFDEDGDWSAVFTGMDRVEATVRLANFSRESRFGDHLYITATARSPNRITISGPPSILETFRRAYPPPHSAHIPTLYHASSLLPALENILLDIEKQGISYPDFKDLKTSLRSPVSGMLLRSVDGGSLLRFVLSTILVEPVRWDRVAEELHVDHALSSTVRILNFGPGLSAASSIVRFGTAGFQRLDMTSQDGLTMPSFNPKHVPTSSTSETEQSYKTKQVPIAIIGMGINMPGASNVDALWEVLMSERSTISDVPSDRYTFNSNPPFASKANFLERPGAFDAGFFGISPREARAMDPQQRLVLHAAYDALQDAGYAFQKQMVGEDGQTYAWKPDEVGVWVGAATQDWSVNARDEAGIHYATGTLRAFLSGRVSYALGFSGPSVTVDTACSSTLVAMHHACRALHIGDCSAAVVAGVNVIANPEMTKALDDARFLSRTGQSKPFDASADGYARGEGCGAFVLKRLADAERDNDNVLGVIRAIEVNQSGLADSITRPLAFTQALLYRQLLISAGHMDPRRVTVIEAHGTGTSVGDPVEMKSIHEVFAQNLGRTNYNVLSISSIKGNIGHLEAASGAAGLAKLLLMLRHRIIPAQASFLELNAKIKALGVNGTSIPITAHVWATNNDGSPRVAVLNNFGAAGSNAALILEEHRRVSPTPMPFADVPLVFVLTAKTQQGLESYRRSYIEWLSNESTAHVHYKDIAYTTTARRDHCQYRMSVAARNRTQLLERLVTADIANISPQGSGRVVFLFSGQGGQYLGMGSGLYKTYMTFRHDINRCHDIAIEKGFPGFVDIITGQTGTRHEPEAFQAAIFSLQWALSRLWISWGIHPSAVIGHSLGEYAALVIAGVLSVTDALSIVVGRARLIFQKCPSGTTGMMAIELPIAEILDCLRSYPSLNIACYNGPAQTVVAGPLSDITLFKGFLERQSQRCMILDVPFAYHSTAMQPVLEDLTLLAESFHFSAPAIPVISTVLGRIIMPGTHTFDKTYVARHCAEPVRFTDGVGELVSRLRDVTACIEIGPHPMCIPMIKANPSISELPLLIGSLKKRQDPLATMADGLGKLALSNVTIEWRRVFRHVCPSLSHDLPTYPFSKEIYWYPYRDPSGHSPSTVGPQSIAFSVIRAWIQYPDRQNGMVAKFKTPIEDLSIYMAGHEVIGRALCPASTFMELVLAGSELASCYTGQNFHTERLSVDGMRFFQPLVYHATTLAVVTTSITLLPDGAGNFSITSADPTSTASTTHCTGAFTQRKTASTVTAAGLFEELLGDMIPEPSIHMDSHAVYQVHFPRVVKYAPEYQTIQSIKFWDDPYVKGKASVQLPVDGYAGKYAIQPASLDTMLHVPGFISNFKCCPNDIYVCSEIESVVTNASQLNRIKKYQIHCKQINAEDGLIICDSFAVTCPESGDSPAVVAAFKGIHFRRVPLKKLEENLTNQPHIRSNPEVISAIEEPLKTSHVSINRIIQIIAQTCEIPVQSLNDRTSLELIGVDSLMSIELFDRVRFAFPQLAVDLSLFLRCSTIADIHEFINEALQQVTNCHIIDVLASTLGVASSEISGEEDFDILGLNSSNSARFIQTLNDNHGLDLMPAVLDVCTNIKALNSYISLQLFTGPPSQGTASVPGAFDTIQFDLDSIIEVLRLKMLPVPIQTGSQSTMTPLFLIHDGSGLINYYARLAPLNRPIWGIHNPHFISSQPWDGLGAMAAQYATYIKEVVGEGPVLLGGWSFGGVLAFEVAQQLSRQGVVVRGVILIDSPSPSDHLAIPGPILENVVLGPLAGSSDIGKLIKAQFQMNAGMLNGYQPAQPIARVPLTLLRSKEAFSPDGVIDIPAWLGNRQNGENQMLGWETLVAENIKVWDIPGHHFSPFKPPNVLHVSDCIAQACAYLEDA